MPTVAAPGGQHTRFPYTPQGQQQAQSYAQQTGGQVMAPQQGRNPYGGPHPGPQTSQPGQQQAAQSLMGYMPMMRQQQGVQPYGYDPMEVWHSIYDLMNNPQLQAGLSGAAPQHLNLLTQPLREIRMGGPTPLPMPQPGPGPIGAPGMMQQPPMPGGPGMGMMPGAPANPMMGQPQPQFPAPYTQQAPF